MTTNRLSESQNRQIAEWLGIEPEYLSVMGGVISSIPTFDTRDGFWLIMDNGPKRDKWKQFAMWGRGRSFWMEIEGRTGGYWWGIDQDYIGPRLAVELINFIEEGH